MNGVRGRRRPRLRRQLPVLLSALVAVALFFAVALPSAHLDRSLGQSAFVTGYSLFGLVVLLALFNGRKRLAVLPLVQVRAWTIAHVVGGLLALALFWLHTGAFWPGGLYEQLLAGLFYAVAFSGVVGLVLQQVYPRRLTQSGVEVIFERIPEEIVNLRESAEALILECTRAEGSDTLARFYVETLHWFFRRPRFVVSHLWGSQGANFWITQQIGTARRYLGPGEERYLEELRELAYAKARLDMHHAMQGMLKIWLHLHVPAAVALITLALWHLLIVNIYGL